MSDGLVNGTKLLTTPMSYLFHTETAFSISAAQCITNDRIVLIDNERYTQ